MFLRCRCLNQNRLLPGLFIVLFLLSVAGHISAQVNVFDISGDWRVSGNTLRKGQELKESDVIVNSSGNRNDFIIIKSNGETLASRFCNRTDCSKKLVVKKVPSSSSSFLSSLWNPVMSYWSDSPRYVVNIVRGGLPDGVVFIYKENANLTDYFQKLTPEKYRLKFGDLLNRNNAFQIDIDMTKNPESVEIKGLSKGLYEISKLNDPSSSAWLLIVPIEKYCESKTAFDRFQEETKNWEKEGVSLQTIRGFNRAFLDYLANGKSVK